LAIDNLLSNAIKFSKKNGNIKIALTENYYSIKDDKIGILLDSEVSRGSEFKLIWPA